MTGIEVRPSVSDDFDSFWQCLDAVARERRYLAMTEAPDRDSALEYLNGARARGMTQFVALDGGRVVGWCDITPGHWEGTRHAGSLGMGVLPAYRGRGIGSALLAATVDAARAAGVTRVDLEVFRSNQTAITLYEKAGFVREGVKQKARILDGVADALIVMARIFG